MSGFARPSQVVPPLKPGLGALVVKSYAPALKTRRAIPGAPAVTLRFPFGASTTAPAENARSAASQSSPSGDSSASVSARTTCVPCLVASSNALSAAAASSSGSGLRLGLGLLVLDGGNAYTF